MPLLSFAAKIEALRKIHSEMIAKRYPNAATLSKLLEVSTKTVHTYLNALPELSGVAPRYNRSKRGYFYPSKVSAEFAPRLREDEVIAYFLLDESARCFRGTPVSQFLDSALAKFSTLLPVGNGITLDDLTSAMSLRLERAPAHPPVAGVLAALYDATLNRRQIEFVYQSRERKFPERRIVNPLHLTRCEGQWYLVAYCNLRHDIRTFVPGRMREATPLKTRFVPPKDFNAVEHFKSAFGIVAGKETINVSLLFKAEVASLIAERVWHSTQRLEFLPDGSVRLTMTCTDSRELLAWLMSWGENLLVEYPKSLQDQLAEAHRIASVIERRHLSVG